MYELYTFLDKNIFGEGSKSLFAPTSVSIVFDSLFEGFAYGPVDPHTYMRAPQDIFVFNIIAVPSAFAFHTFSG